MNRLVISPPNPVPNSISVVGSRSLLVDHLVFPIRSCKFGSRRGLRPSVLVWCGGDRIEVVEKRRKDGDDVDDGFYMRRCVELAGKAVGCTSPNPMVGCVIVKDGVVVGEGFHPKAGQPHAEVFALRHAGEVAAMNSTAYVSLEPCNHYGRTPPCTESLIRAGVKRVVVGMVDPNPIVASKGVEKLRESGISVSVGIEEDLCRKLNEAYIHKMLSGKPFVTLRCKFQLSDDVIDEKMDPQLLQENDCVVISSKSKLLLPLLQERKKPLIIIVHNCKDCSPLRVPAFLMDDRTRVVIFHEKNSVIEPDMESNLKQQGVEMVVFDEIKLCSIIEYCSGQGMCGILFDLLDRVDEDCCGVLEGIVDGDVHKVVVKVIKGETEQLSGINVGRKTLKVGNVQVRSVEEDRVLVEGYVSIKTLNYLFSNAY